MGSTGTHLQGRRSFITSHPFCHTPTPQNLLLIVDNLITLKKVPLLICRLRSYHRLKRWTLVILWAGTFGIPKMNMSMELVTLTTWLIHLASLAAAVLTVSFKMKMYVSSFYIMTCELSPLYLYLYPYNTNRGGRRQKNWHGLPIILSKLI